MTGDNLDSCAYVRAFYGVPAKAGMRIKLGYLIDGNSRSGQATTGIIRGADHLLLVMLDGEHTVRRVHPTWCIAYLDETGKVIVSYGDTD
jgi:hypothetical protein